tara:strand:+ start:305 stop:571 length:267 start_codon:yes stop_codon:yes gene_type:complete
LQVGSENEIPQRGGDTEVSFMTVGVMFEVMAAKVLDEPTARLGLMDGKVDVFVGKVAEQEEAGKNLEPFCGHCKIEQGEQRQQNERGI